MTPLLSATDWAERGWLPDSLIRLGIRRMLRQRLQGTEEASEAHDELAQRLANGPMVIHAKEANLQHYEVPAEFFQRVLGSHLKYSCGYWPRAEMTLEQAEAAMLALTAERAEIQDGMRILELGCGWGSLTLWLAEHFPRARITAISNSRSQKAFIDARCREHGYGTVEVVTANIADFSTRRRYDRVVSVEMFEHVRNHRELLQRVAHWLTPSGRLFVHIFCHRSLTYLFETEGEANWMGRHFFSGGMMPSAGWLRRFAGDLEVSQQWTVGGQHYQKTCEAWLSRLDHQFDELLRLFRADLSGPEAARQLRRWRIFFLACAELFGYRNGQEWFVSHYLFVPTESTPQVSSSLFQSSP